MCVYVRRLFLPFGLTEEHGEAEVHGSSCESRVEAYWHVEQYVPVTEVATP